MERIQLTLRPGQPLYRLWTPSMDPSSIIRSTSPDSPQIYEVDGHTIVPIHLPLDPAEREDPRGHILLFEPPKPGDVYIQGVDPTQGVTGWQRETHLRHRSRRRGLRPSDNGVIEIFVAGQRNLKDRQVLEFAAPIDAQTLALYVFIFGRLYVYNLYFLHLVLLKLHLF